MAPHRTDTTVEMEVALNRLQGLDMEIFRIPMFRLKISHLFTPLLTHSNNHPHSQPSQQHRGDSSSQVRAFGRYCFILLSALYCLYKTRTDTLLFTPTRWSEYYVILVSMPHILYSYFSHIHPYCQHLANAECHFHPSKFW